MGHLIIPGIVEPLTAPSTFPAVGTPLNSLTWEEVRAISDAGLASSYFAVGDTKTIVINGTVGKTTFSNFSIDVFILGFDHNASIEGSNRIHFGLGKIGGKCVALCDSEYDGTRTSSGSFIMNTTATNVGGWNSSHMRKTVLGSDSMPTSPTANTLLAALPFELLTVMKAITKRTNNTNGDTDTNASITSTTDYLPLMAEYEVFGVRSQANNYEKNYQKQYDFYVAGNSKVAYKHSNTIDAAKWWLRSPGFGSKYGFCYVASTMGIKNDYTGTCTSRGVLPCFAV